MEIMLKYHTWKSFLGMLVDVLILMLKKDGKERNEKTRNFRRTLIATFEKILYSHFTTPLEHPLNK